MSLNDFMVGSERVDEDTRRAAIGMMGTAYAIARAFRLTPGQAAIAAYLAAASLAQDAGLETRSCLAMAATVLDAQPPEAEAGHG